MCGSLRKQHLHAHGLFTQRPGLTAGIVHCCINDDDRQHWKATPSPHINLWRRCFGLCHCRGVCHARPSAVAGEHGPCHLRNLLQCWLWASCRCAVRGAIPPAHKVVASFESSRCNLYLTNHANKFWLSALAFWNENCPKACKIDGNRFPCRSRVHSFKGFLPTFSGARRMALDGE